MFVRFRSYRKYVLPVIKESDQDIPPGWLLENEDESSEKVFVNSVTQERVSNLQFYSLKYWLRPTYSYLLRSAQAKPEA